ncbi:hypothetical protein HYT84_04870, partial [Candidatus Micrarchaeota archaeon]|nr:hypothetical protein [Candidatus Micrarchaeota archaeon]
MARILNQLYKSPKLSHKGQNGKLLIIGGSKKYHGAPVFSILAARRFVDLVYFYPGEPDLFLIRAVKPIPEIIVVKDLDLITKGKVDCVLFGVGFGNAKFSFKKLLNVRRLVVDGDGFKLIKNKLALFAKNNVDLIITPHEK